MVERGGMPVEREYWHASSMPSVLAETIKKDSQSFKVLSNQYIRNNGDY